MQKSTLIMAAVGVWVGAGVIFLVWYMGGDDKPDAPGTSAATENAPVASVKSEPAAAPSKPAATANPLESTSIAAASLPATSSQTPPLDGAKVSIEVPAGWKAMSRSSKYVIGMTKPNLTMPQILVLKADDYSELADINSENATKMAAAIQKELTDQKKSLTTPVMPVVVNRHSGDSIQVLRFARKAKQAGSSVVVNVLTILCAREGLRYEVELRSHADTFEEAANAAFAVAASIEPTGATDFGGSFSAPESTDTEDAAPADAAPEEDATPEDATAE